METWSECCPRCSREPEDAESGNARRQWSGEQVALFPEGLHAQVAEVLAGITWTVINS
jgi:hypothetical protein